VLINDTFLTHLTYNGVSTSHGGAVPHTRVSILHGRDVPTLYSRCLDLSRGRHLHISLFSCFHLHALFFPPFSSNSLQYASLSRRSGTHTHASSETCYYQLPFFPQEGVMNHPFTTCNEFSHNSCCPLVSTPVAVTRLLIHISAHI